MLCQSAESLNKKSNTLTSCWKSTRLVAGNLTIGSLKAQNYGAG